MELVISRDEATVYEGVSVRRSDGPSVRRSDGPSVTSYLFGLSRSDLCRVYDLV